MYASSHCRTSIFEKEFKFQYVRGDIRIHIATHYFDIFLKVTLCLAVEIWKSSLTLCITSPWAVSKTRAVQLDIFHS